MDFVAVKDLKSPVELRRKLRDNDSVVVTNNGSPMAVMVGVETPGELDRVLEMMRKIRVHDALEALWTEAEENGTNQLTLDEINDEIQAARRERREREQSQGLSGELQHSK